MNLRRASSWVLQLGCTCSCPPSRIMARRWRDRGRHASPPPPTPTARALAGPRPPSWTPPRRRRGRWAGGGPSAGGADRAGAACDDGDSRSRSRDSRPPVRVDFAAHGRPVCKRTPQPPAAQAPLHFTIQVHGRRGAARRCRATAVDGSSSSSTIATAPPVVITMELSQDEADLVQALRRELARAP